MIIDGGYLLLNKTSEFNNRLVNYFYKRLQLFLCISDENKPSVVFTNSNKIISELYGEVSEGPHTCRAFYDEISGKVVFDAKRYNIQTDRSFIDKQYIPELYSMYDFKYIIPLSDIYHELIHHVQYNYISYQYDDFLEALADIYVYIITGDWNIDYLNASIALWYVSTKIVKLNEQQFYVMLRNAIIDVDFFKNNFMENKEFMKLLVNNYGGNLSQFLNNFKKDFGDRAYEDEFYNFIKRIHNLIFYKY